MGQLKHPNRATLYLLYTSLCTGEHKCFLCSPFYGRACRWAMLGELIPKGPEGPQTTQIFYLPDVGAQGRVVSSGGGSLAWPSQGRISNTTPAPSPSLLHFNRFQIRDRRIELS